MHWNPALSYWFPPAYHRGKGTTTFGGSSVKTCLTQLSVKTPFGKANKEMETHPVSPVTTVPSGKQAQEGHKYLTRHSMNNVLLLRVRPRHPHHDRQRQFVDAIVSVLMESQWEGGGRGDHRRRLRFHPPVSSRGSVGA